MGKKNWIATGAGVGLLGMTALAAAQAVEPADAGLEEVIVTAQKRAENLQDVPVSVTALSAETIANQRIVDFADLSRAAPSLTVTESTSSPNSSIVLRGIGTFAFSISVEPSVAVVVDDVAVVQQAQAFNNLSDIERIEVLRGPQGTLFGKNASAGVVNIVTQGPAEQFTAGVQLTATDDQEYRAEGSLSGPVGEASGYRVNAYYLQRQGFVRNLTNGTNINDDGGFGVRAKFKSALTDNFTVTLTGDYSERTQDGTGTTLRAVGDNARLFGAIPYNATLVGITPGAGNYNARLSEDAPTKNQQSSLSLKAQWDLGDFDVVSISSYQDWKYRFVNDVDGTDLDVLGVLSGGAAHGGINQGGPYHSKQVTQEVRLVSTGDGALKYVLGGYYSKADTDRGFERGPVALVARWAATAGTRSLAAFGQFDYSFTDTTRLSAGVRANSERISVDFQNLNVPATPPANNATCLAVCSGENKDSVVTWKLALQHDLADGVMAFASAATGYKGQAYDIVTGFGPAKATTPVKPEKSKAYEIGLKSRFLDNKVQLNATAFWTDYDNFQAQAAVLDATTNPATLRLGLNNVGKLRTRGVELELSAKPSSWLRLDAAASYTDAVIKDFPTANCYAGQTVAEGCVDIDGAGPLTAKVQNLAGAPLANAPKIKLTLGANAEFAWGNSGLDGFAGLALQHQSAVNFDLFRNPLTEQKAYSIVNGNIGFAQGDEGKLKVTLFVNNLFDKHYAANLTDGFGTFGNVHVLNQVLSRNSQRYFGVKVGYRF